MALTLAEGRRRVIIEGITPQVDGGRFPIKRTVGDLVHVEADLFGDGHDGIAASLLVHREGSDAWTEIPMTPLTNDRWAASFRVSTLGRYGYKVQGWVDHFTTWRRDMLKRIDAATDAPVDYLIGAELIAQGAARTAGPDAEWLSARAAALRTGQPVAELQPLATAVELHQRMLRVPDKRFVSESEQELAIVVDPVRARFSSWYEFFPRSTAAEPGAHGTFADAEKMLAYAAEMGFNVVYMPPIHPIGRLFRKGKNNNPQSEPGECGSPWAIGSEEGGHKAIHPQLGTREDFEHFVAAAKALNLSVALDIAFQVAPDHPYVRLHENWFNKRPDGTIQYAENPPKKYQDIYPINFESEDWQGLWQELKSIFTYWLDEGVSIFRVDNPHTKAFPFWEWLITEIKRDHPQALFLSEAFTRPKVMYRLAKVGFSQSYTYFPWRIEKRGLMEYLTETSQTAVREFFRPNQWTNTPDILIDFLQTGGRAAFMIRHLLAATLGANYGIYGPAFELQEHEPIRAGSEEYLNSEKYEIRHWDLDRAGSLKPLISKVNAIRNESAALQNDWSLRFHYTDNDQLLCYSKESDDRSNLLVMVVNLDPRYTQSGYVTLPLYDLGIPEGAPYDVEDLLTGEKYQWLGPRNYVELHPSQLPGHILRVLPRPVTPPDTVIVV
ncbi:MAG TPA: alpha-1,4-glucan--maltose-1-phosphate maltosyltransferase [Terracidiphilus sp.]